MCMEGVLWFIKTLHNKAEISMSLKITGLLLCFLDLSVVRIILYLVAGMAFLYTNWGSTVQARVTLPPTAVVSLPRRFHSQPSRLGTCYQEKKRKKKLITLLRSGHRKAIAQRLTYIKSRQAYLRYIFIHSFRFIHFCCTQSLSLVCLSTSFVGYKKFLRSILKKKKTP